MVGFRKSLKTRSDPNGHWQLVIPGDIVPQGEESNVYLEVSGKNKRIARFNLKIVQASEIVKIILDNPIPQYVKSANLKISGVVKSLSPLESFVGVLHSKVQKLSLIHI